MDGAESDAGTLFWKIVDETGVMDLVINFIIQFIMGKLLYYICVPIYGALPRSIQATLQELSDRGEAWVQWEKAKREQWAQENDFLQILPYQGTRTAAKPSRLLDLDDDWHKK